MHPQDTSVHIPLYHGYTGALMGYTLGDADDAVWVNQRTWRLHSNGYASRYETEGGRAQAVFLHREILGLPRPYNGLEGDHINRDRLDNRRANLRIASRSENQQNRPSYTGSTSAYRGVHWKTSIGKWCARVAYNGRQLHVGYFNDESAAGRAPAEARARLMPFATD